ncbi:rod shape-determining protein MreD [Roseobacter sinensis]|uniref:Rod shape-determining protein MreD n=1 Tax=Roseobacter sinensis TaxID=2931391 RepID=A0ABT3BD01_9RHOB|nr:rod shape-determining protein MreD [Roseobacter sp. WL0113]MCV3271437.1 rod shape-determining protein MreD [Roseobacter sp. WL0113]
MSELPQTRLWTMRLGFALLVCVILFFHLLPLETTPRRWVGPDLLLAFACAWSLRRPEYVPVLALAGLFLLADLLLQRPPGLWAMVALLGCESLKRRARGLRDTGFASEWLRVAIVMVSVAIFYRALLIITLVDLPPFGLTIFETVMTILFYPLVVAATHGLMRVRKATPGDLDSTGARL